MEYITTWSVVPFDGGEPWQVRVSMPEGEGWKLVTSTTGPADMSVPQDSLGHGGGCTLFWTWEREA